MDQQLRASEERLTPQEAEEVIKRFREEEELRQREMEAQATNPTVADLAEGLGVPAERISSILAGVRGDSVPPAPLRPTAFAPEQAGEGPRRSSRTAWIIAAAVICSLLMVELFAAIFFTTTRVEKAGTPAPAPESVAGGATTDEAEAGAPSVPFETANAVR